MELLIPIIGLGGLYIISNNQKKKESFSNLPNVDIPNRNYPGEYPIVSPETDLTSALSTTNAFQSPNGVYTDKFFDPAMTTTANYDTPFSSISKGQRTTNQDFHSMTGEVVDSSYFSHNNMVPFFGSKRRDIHSNANVVEGILDNMNGSGSQTITKSEQSPLFKPEDNVQWAFGVPNTTDFYKSRMNVSMKMENVKPFAEQRVGPGLDLGYTTEGCYGYNSGMAAREKWVDRGVDELRVLNKPKSSGHLLYGHEGPADSYIKQMGNMGHGIQEKNRPETTFAMGPERLFTTTGIEKAPMLYPNHIERYVNRPETNMEYTGGAGFVDTENSYIPGEYRESTNIQLGQVPFSIANAGGRNYATEEDYGIKSNKAYANNRSVGQRDSYFGIVGGAITEAVAPLLDILRPSRKENTIGTLRPYQNAKAQVPQSYMFNPADRAPTTIRETTENSKFHLNINRNTAQQGGGYLVSEQQPIQNSRMLTSDFFYSGNSSAGAGSQQTRAYDAEYRQRNNDVKSSTNVGYTTGGNMNLLNTFINQRNVNTDGLLQNKRKNVPNLPYQSPSMESMGKLQGSGQQFSTIQLDRNNGDILGQLKGNPYVINTASQL
jgi:hypothetical protein